MFPNDSLVRLDTVHLIEIIIQCRATRGARNESSRPWEKYERVINRDCAPSQLVRFESAVGQIEIHRFSKSRSSRSKPRPFRLSPSIIIRVSPDPRFNIIQRIAFECTFEQRRRPSL